jgi:DNA-binding NarL/FixJ family response regulator
MNEKKEPASNNKNRILVVDDHAVIREGLALLINLETDLVVFAEAENAEQALDILKQQPFDLAIVDISLEGTSGIQLTERIKSQFPHLPVLILTMHDEALYAKDAFEAGARGYVTKREAAGTIIAAIRLILSGKSYMSEKMA